MDSTTQPTSTGPASPAPANAPPTGAVPGPPAIYPPQPAAPLQAQPAAPVTYSIYRVVYNAFVILLILSIAGVLGGEIAWDKNEKVKPLAKVAYAADGVSLIYHGVMMTTSPDFKADFPISTLVLGSVSTALVVTAVGMKIHSLTTHHGAGAVDGDGHGDEDGNGHGHGHGKGVEDKTKVHLGWSSVGLQFALLAAFGYACYDHHMAECAEVMRWLLGAFKACGGHLVHVVLFVFRQPQRLVKKVCGDDNV